ncbi:MAG: hypothetical protein RJA44_2646 [Pseudomonadota bacterium]
MQILPRPILALFTLLLALCGPSLSLAHDFRVGDVVVDHPYATPSAPTARNGALHFKHLKNTGTQPDRLVSISTPVAESVEMHQAQLVNDVMQMRAQPALELPPGADLAISHNDRSYHLMLVGLKQPLKNGDRFPITLTFERGGSRELQVWVQQPRDKTAARLSLQQD